MLKISSLLKLITQGDFTPAPPPQDLIFLLNAVALIFFLPFRLSSGLPLEATQLGLLLADLYYNITLYY